MVNGGPLPPRYLHTPRSSFVPGATPTPEETVDGQLGGESADGPVASGYPPQDLGVVLLEVIDEVVAGTSTELAEQCILEVRGKGDS